MWDGAEEGEEGWGWGWGWEGEWDVGGWEEKVEDGEGEGDGEGDGLRGEEGVGVSECGWCDGVVASQDTMIAVEVVSLA